MLSKLEFFESHSAPPPTTAEQIALLDAVVRHYNEAGKKVSATPHEGGTLGVCLSADIDGERRFLKSHLPGAQAHANLAKESEMLGALYGATVVTDRLSLRMDDGSVRLCLVLAELSPRDRPMDGAEAAALAHGLAAKLGGRDRWRLKASETFEHYLLKAEDAIAALADLQMVSATTARELSRTIGSLGSSLPSLRRTMCHGDFGPRNVMTEGATNVVIDWEDAFWGVAGYDYLYWLTFFENRHLLNSPDREPTELMAEDERGILALIVLLKSYLSIRSGTHRSHSLSIDERLAEILGQ